MITNLVIKGSENNMSSKNKLKSTLLFAGATTLAIHLFNKYIAQSALLNQIFKKENNTYYESVFGKIYYKKEGSGSPVLLIHDFNLGSSSITEVTACGFSSCGKCLVSGIPLILIEFNLF